jgi:hypothetical protein
MLYSRELRCALLALLILAPAVGVFVGASRAQNAEPQNNNRPRRTDNLPEPSPTPPVKPDDETTLHSDEVVRVETNLTSIFFTAADRQKRFVTTLKREDLRVLEDGVPQEIFTFQQNVEMPLSLAILIDTSGSEERTLPEEKAAIFPRNGYS